MFFSYSFFSPLIYIQKHWEKSSFHPSRTLVWTLFTPTWLTMKTLDWCRWWWWWKKYHIRQTKIFECLIVFAVFCVYRCSVLYIFFRFVVVQSSLVSGFQWYYSVGWWWLRLDDDDDDPNKTTTMMTYRKQTVTDHQSHYHHYSPLQLTGVVLCCFLMLWLWWWLCINIDGKLISNQTYEYDKTPTNIHLILITVFKQILCYLRNGSVIVTYVNCEQIDYFRFKQIFQTFEI